MNHPYHTLHTLSHLRDRGSDQTRETSSSLSELDSLLSRPFSGFNLSNNHRIIVGVDFGTTFTGVSYIDSSTSKLDCSTRDVHDFRTWPGPGRETDAVWKTPSRIAYSSENSGITTNQFGYQVTPKMISYSWTKLLLDSNSNATEFDDPSLRSTEGEGMLKLPNGKSAEEVVTDYLREIYRWIIDQLANRISPEVLDLTPMEFWFGVPAIWSDRAKSATLSAAKNAGFASGDADKLQLIPEPEAAGVAILKGFSQASSITRISPGDGILICDCGGGTVDINSYTVLQVTPKLEFEELVEGIGGKCGSTYIDRAFHQWMSAKFGRAFQELSIEKTGPGSHFMKEFESRKRDFGYSPGRDSKYRIDLDQTYEINLVIPRATNSKHYDSDETVVKFSARTMQRFFDPVVSMILELLEHQVGSVCRRYTGDTLKRIILVGGFGDSLYLTYRVREWGRKRGMSVLCPADPQAAIARGAALRGLECIAPIKRRSRRHYGIRCSLPFREGIDLESSAYICAWSNRKFCVERIDWAVAKGAVIDETTNIVVEHYDTYIEGDPLIVQSQLYSSSADVAPTHVSDAGVERVATLTHMIDKTQLMKCPRKRVNGQNRWRVEHQKEIYVGTRESTLSFNVMRDGKTWGKTEIVYDGKQASWGRKDV